jgi:CRP-like cAMP-binding protein
MQPLVVGSGVLGTAGRLGNALLDALPPEALGRIASSLELRLLTVGEELQRPGKRPCQLIFPTSAVVSLAAMLASGETAEVGAVGPDGVIGLGLVLGGDGTTQHAVVQVSGAARCLGIRPLTQELARCAALRDVILAYCHALMTQLAQNVVCGRLHAVEPRLCRWLLAIADRSGSDEIMMTQEAIAWVLGVRREAVTIAAHHLQAAQAIRYARGRIVIVDRARLEARACECYGMLRQEASRLARSDGRPGPEVPAPPRRQAPTVTTRPVASDS